MNEYYIQKDLVIMIQEYVSLPVTIEAIQLTLKLDIVNLSKVWPGIRIHIMADPVLNKRRCFIKTLEGEMEGHVGDWIIKGTIGEFYFCKDEVFQKKYRPKQSLETSADSVPAYNMQAERLVNCFFCRKLVSIKECTEMHTDKVFKANGELYSPVNACKNCHAQITQRTQSEESL